MDPEAHDRLQQRIREIIAEKHNLKLKHHKTEGGFLHLLPLVASALPSVVEAGKKLFGSGKHKPDAKTRKPNAHALLVKQVYAEAKARGEKIDMPEASRRAKILKTKSSGIAKPKAKGKAKK
jgi:hypothetical protein